jgi:hypothetical protein
MKLSDSYPWTGNLEKLPWLLNNLRWFGSLPEDYSIRYDNITGALTFYLQGRMAECVGRGNFLWTVDGELYSGDLGDYHATKALQHVPVAERADDEEAPSAG